MITIPGSLLQEAARTDAAHVWVELLDFALPYGRHWRIANNTEPIAYAGNVYHASSFTPTVTALNKDARMPQFSLALSGLGRELDEWLNRAGGLEGCTLTVILVNTLDLTADYSGLTTVYDILGHGETAETIEVEIGGPNLYRHRFPFRKCTANHCDLVFKGALCGYAGAETECGAYTLARCRELGNAARFGGSPGLRANSLRIVQ